MSTITQSESDEQRTSTSSFVEVLEPVRKRILSIGILSSLFWAITITMLVLITAFWVDLLWELPASFRAGAIWVSLAAGVILFLVKLQSTFKKTDPGQMARRIDESANTGGTMLSGLELAGRTSTNRNEVTEGLAEMAVAQAATKAKQIEQHKVVSWRPVNHAAILCGVVLSLIVIVAVLAPGLAQTQLSRFANPTNETPPFTTIAFDVTPGSTDVIYGSDLEIAAQLSESTADNVEMIVEKPDGQQQRIPMFSKTDNRWRTIMARIVEPFDFYIRSGRSRSEKYSVNLVLVPEIRGVQLSVTPPAYTGLPTTTGAIPDDGIEGLAGTKIEISIDSNRPLSGGQLAIEYAETKQQIALEVSAENDQQVHCSLELTQNGKFEIDIEDVEGLNSNQRLAGSLKLLSDHRPFVRILSPQPVSLATTYAILPVRIDAEDDYGISRIELYRSLNDSRYVPMTLPVDQKHSKRTTAQFKLPLAAYELEPGDVIKLFARVEDNDPAEPKGSESPIHQIQIISQERFEQMRRSKMGVEAIFAKYRQIARQLERLENELNDLDDQLKKEIPDSDAADLAQNAADQLRREAEMVRKAARNQFDIDLDRELEERFRELEQQFDQAANQIAEFMEKFKKGEITKEELRKQIEQIRKKIGQEREDFERDVIQPVNDLAKTLPLMMKAQEFVQLVMRQRSLAERLVSMKDQENVDDPALKRRMRERADEQRQLTDQLDDILGDIQNLAVALPPGQEFDALRESALDFVDMVEDSDAFFEMEHAELGLGEFSGSRGHRHADTAATILEKFLEDNQEIQEQGEQANQQIFKPGGGMPRLGNTARQLMQMFGRGGGKGGQGGGGNGFSQRSNTSRNVGLYGANPVQSARSGRGDQRKDGVAGSGQGGRSEAGANPGEALSTSAGTSNTSNFEVPTQYKSKVGEYFRRIVEESSK